MQGCSLDWFATARLHAGGRKSLSMGSGNVLKG